MMEIKGLRQAHWMVQRLKGIGRHRAIILMYHRIGELDPDPWYLRVRPENFDDQMRILRQRMRPISLSQLAHAVGSGTLPDRAVVVTFDDGYANNLHLAKPLLERYDIPATVFVTTGYIGTTTEYWWDRLEQILLRPGTLPLHLQTSALTLELGAAAEYTREEYQHDCAHTRDPSHRLQFYYRVWEVVRSLPETERRRVLEELQAWAGSDVATRESHRSLTPDELCALRSGSLISIGAHTVTHPLLPDMPADEQRREIRNSKMDLETLLREDISLFSYPFGRYVDETVSIVASEGFQAACSVTHALIHGGANRLLLPRFSVFDWCAEEFEHHLLRWIGGSVA